ncbi:imidazole glycerol phosphate synthase subunit HisH [Sphingobacteriaceae bacterium]|nr:imidazole glycerol phosphate synthase subunit HisH [Sphingobacteriaceae bacterium]
MIVIIKYNAGNSRSVKNAIDRLGYVCEISDDKELIKTADKIIFPGVGEASSAMDYLKENKLDLLIKQLKQPFLGICLGQHLMCQSSEEGNTSGLGIFAATVKKFPALQTVPHMGWNNLRTASGELFRGISEETNFYFVHSYYAGLCKETTAVCDYILPFSAAMQKDNFYATQFHPEKSGDAGELILKNFLDLV